MKAQLLIPATLLVSVALVPLIKMRKGEQMRQDRLSMVLDIKLRVTTDVLREYEQEKEAVDGLVVEKTAQLKEAEAQLSALRQKRDEAQNNADICSGLQKFAVDELATTEMALDVIQASNEKDKANWESNVATLRSDLAKQSSLCDFLRPDAHGKSTFCKQEPPKAEAPKQEEPKPEEPEPEEPKPEAPNQEEPKPEAPNQEEPEAPNQEEPKPEAPNQEEPKPEAPNQEEPKPDAPNPEEPKPEVPKPVEPQVEAPKPEDPKNRSLK